MHKNDWLRITILCLLIGIALRIAYGQLTGVAGNDKIIVVQGIKEDGNLDQWLLVESTSPDFAHQGFTPGGTRLISNYRPLYWQTAPNQWRIVFTK